MKNNYHDNYKNNININYLDKEEDLLEKVNIH